MNTAIGKNIKRKDAWYKVTGQAKYTDDFPTSGLLDARLLTSTHAHARIKSIDISKALGVKGVSNWQMHSQFPSEKSKLKSLL